MNKMLKKILTLCLCIVAVCCLSFVVGCSEKGETDSSNIETSNYWKLDIDGEITAQFGQIFRITNIRGYNSEYGYSSLAAVSVCDSEGVTVKCESSQFVVNDKDGYTVIYSVNENGEYSKAEQKVKVSVSSSPIISCSEGDEFYVTVGDTFEVPCASVTAYNSLGKEIKTSYKVSFDGANVQTSSDKFVAESKGEYIVTFTAADGDKVSEKQLTVYSFDNGNEVYSDFETNYKSDLFTSNEIDFSKVKASDEGIENCGGEYVLKCEFPRFDQYSYYCINFGRKVLKGTTVSFKMYMQMDATLYDYYVLESKGNGYWKMFEGVSFNNWSDVSITLTENSDSIFGYFNFTILGKEVCKLYDGQKIVAYIDDLSFDRYYIEAEYDSDECVFDTTNMSQEEIDGLSYCIDGISVNGYDNYYGKAFIPDFDVKVYSDYGTEGEEVETYIIGGKRYFDVLDDVYTVEYYNESYNISNSFMVYKYKYTKGADTQVDFEDENTDYLSFSDQVASADIYDYSDGNIPLCSDSGRYALKLTANNLWPSLYISEANAKAGDVYSAMVYIDDPSDESLYIQATGATFNNGLGFYATNTWLKLYFTITETSIKGGLMFNYDLGSRTNSDSAIYIDNIESAEFDYDNITFEEGAIYGLTYNQGHFNAVDYPDTVSACENGGEKVLKIIPNNLWPSLQIESGNAVQGEVYSIKVIISDATDTTLYIQGSGATFNNGDGFYATNTWLRLSFTVTATGANGGLMFNYDLGGRSNNDSVIYVDNIKKVSLNSSNITFEEEAVYGVLASAQVSSMGIYAYSDNVITALSGGGNYALKLVPSNYWPAIVIDGNLLTAGDTVTLDLFLYYNGDRDAHNIGISNAQTSAGLNYVATGVWTSIILTATTTGTNISNFYFNFPDGISGSYNSYTIYVDNIVITHAV